MATDFDRDDRIDKILKGAHRRQSTAPAGPSCLDAETLAAWADGGLAENRRIDVERHVADCPRCQVMAAAFAQSDASAARSGATAPVPLRPRQSPLKYWLPLAGTLAASLLIWIGVRDRQPALQPEGTIARTESVPAGRAGNEMQSTKQPESTQAASRAPEPQPTAKPAAEMNRERRLDAVEPVQTRDARVGRGEKAAAPTPQARPLPAPPPAPVPLPAAGIVSTPVPQASAVVAGQQTAVANRQAPNYTTFLPGVGSVVAQFSSNDARDAAVAPVGAAGAASRGGAAGAGGGGGGRAVTAVAAESFARAAPPAHWRILAGDVVQRSTDAAAWETIAIDPPATGLTGGTAPSPLVCWLIGRSGLVLLSTDGRSFARTAVPSAVDLVSIKAIDALRATVTTAQGQTLSTADGGKTWKND